MSLVIKKLVSATALHKRGETMQVDESKLCKISDIGLTTSEKEGRRHANHSLECA